MATTSLETRKRRKRGIRAKIHGSSERPRMTVFRSLKHLYVQVIDDSTGRTLASASTVDKATAQRLAGEGGKPLPKLDQAKQVGAAVAEKCKAAGVGKVVFDRNGYRFHGRVKAVATAAREAGMQF